MGDGTLEHYFRKRVKNEGKPRWFRGKAVQGGLRKETEVGRQ